PGRGPDRRRLPAPARLIRSGGGQAGAERQLAAGAGGQRTPGVAVHLEPALLVVERAEVGRRGEVVARRRAEALVLEAEERRQLVGLALEAAQHLLLAIESGAAERALDLRRADVIAGDELADGQLTAVAVVERHLEQHRRTLPAAQQEVARRAGGERGGIVVRM